MFFKGEKKKNLYKGILIILLLFNFMFVFSGCEKDVEKKTLENPMVNSKKDKRLEGLYVSIPVSYEWTPSGLSMEVYEKDLSQDPCIVMDAVDPYSESNESLKREDYEASIKKNLWHYIKGDISEDALDFEYKEEKPVRDGTKVKGIINNGKTGKKRYFYGYYMNEPKPEGYFIFIYSDSSTAKEIEKSADKAYEGYDAKK